MRTRDGADDVIFAANLVEVRALSHPEFAFDQNAIGSRDQGGKVAIQLHDPDGSGAIDCVDLAVVVKQNGKIMQTLFDPIVLPWAAGIGGPENLETEAVHVGEI